MNTIIREFETNFDVMFRKITDKYSKDNPKYEIITVINDGEVVPLTPILIDHILNSDYIPLDEVAECLSTTLVGGSRTIEIMYTKDICIKMDIYVDFFISAGTHGGYELGTDPETTIHEMGIVNPENENEYSDIKFGDVDTEIIIDKLFEYCEQLD